MKKKVVKKPRPTPARTQKAKPEEARSKRRINTYWRRDGTKVQGHMRKSFGLRNFLFGDQSPSAKNNGSKVWLGVAVSSLVISGATSILMLNPIPICVGVGVSILTLFVHRQQNMK